MALVFLPEPKKIHQGRSCLVLPKHIRIGLSSAELFPAAEEVSRLLARPSLSAITVPSVQDTVTLTLESSCKPKGYRLAITSEGILLAGESVFAVHHAVATLAQIITQTDGDKLPCLEIEDWPDLAVRGVYYDICRGRVPHLERLFELAEGMAKSKLNELQLYVEHTFAFRRHPLIGEGADSLSAEDIMRLDSHCRSLGVELVPSLASFGHMHTVLRHKPYHELAEDFGILSYHPDALTLNPQMASGSIAQSLAPANPKVYDFLDELYDEFLPCFTSEKFNVCCDETWDLGMGQSHALAEKIGKGNLYLGHIKRLNTLAKKHGKRIQFWGDIIRHYPELIASIPKDVTVLDWAYHSGDSFDRLKDFTDTGLDSYVCPSVCSYVTLFPRIPESCDNIANWAKSAVKYGAQGMLNTDWGDGGHFNFLEYSWYGYLFGAEQSWNHRADRKTFTSRFSTLFLKITDTAFCRALDEMGDISHLQAEGYYQSVWLHLFFARPDDGLFAQGRSTASVSEKGVISKKDIPWNAAFAKKTIRNLERIKSVFCAQLKGKGVDPYGLLPYWIFAVDATLHAARKLSVFGQGGINTLKTRNDLVSEMTGLMKRFEELWLARSRRSEIEITLRRYREAIAFMHQKVEKDPWTCHLSCMKVSKVMPRPKSGVTGARCARMKDKLEWEPINARGDNFINIHNRHGNADGIVYLTTKVKVAREGEWDIAFGHDGGAKIFVDGNEACCQPERINPAMPDRTRFHLTLTKGEHEIMIAFDLDHGNGWGVFFRFEVPAKERKTKARAVFPKSID